MAISLSSMQKCPCRSSKVIEDRQQFKCTFPIALEENLLRRRFLVFGSGASLIPVLGINYGLTALPSKAEENNPIDQKVDSDGSIFGAMKTILDPNEKTKSGKVLPKAYLKAARDVVKTLRESLEEDNKDITKFRRTADAAKEAIREFLSGWRGQKVVSSEESYAAIEKAIRSLAKFYAKAGPSAAMTEEVKASILDDLKTAETCI